MTEHQLCKLLKPLNMGYTLKKNTTVLYDGCGQPIQPELKKLSDLNERDILKIYNSRQIKKHLDSMQKNLF